MSKVTLQPITSKNYLDTFKLTHNPREGGAGPLYVKLGFTYTGEIDHDEPVMVMELAGETS